MATSSKCNISNPTKTLPNQKSISKKSRIFAIIRNTTVYNEAIDSLQIRICINKALLNAKASSYLEVASIILNPRGNIVVLTKDNCTASDIFQLQKQIQKALNSLDKHTESIKTSEDWAKVLFYGIYEEYFPNIVDGIEKLKKEIEDLNCNVNIMNMPKYYSRPERKEGK